MTYIHHHREIPDPHLASRNLAMHIALQVVAELLCYRVHQNYLCKMKWNCDVTAKHKNKNAVVGRHCGAPCCLACETVSLLPLGLALPKASCFFSHLSSRVRACHIAKLI